MLGRLKEYLPLRLPDVAINGTTLLGAPAFELEVHRERVRSTRRAIPFCIVSIDVEGDFAGRRRRTRRVERVLHRDLRVTDRKARLRRARYAVLLVDTPEMGGRVVMDRLRQLFGRADVRVTLSLEVHDPDGFGDSDRGDPGWGGGEGGDPVGQRVGVASRRDDQPVRAFEGAVRVVDGALSVTGSPLRGGIKRAIDIVGATLGLVVSAPILAIAAVAIRWTDGAPALFTQTREGRDGRPFTIYKLRTMDVDAESRQDELRVHSHRDGPAFKIERDPRVTPIGNVLRKTCIDELPQLVNVLRGEMSLVGPRPLPWHESRACDRWHRRRLDVRPGLTCYWQVDKSRVQTFDDWMRLDLRYLDRPSLWADARLLARTLIVPLRGRGGQ